MLKFGKEGKMMKVMQIRIKIYILADISAEKIQAEISTFLDSGLAQNEQFAELHQENKYKGYCYDSLYPVEADKVYKKDKIYTLTIRTIDTNLAKYFAEQVVNNYTASMKGIMAEIKVIPKKHIDMLYTLTPVILKCEKGYWKDSLSLEQYEERLKVNLLKKWKQFYGEKLEENFELFTGMEFLNKCPVAVEYKEIKLLGDKLRLHVADNKTAQSLAYLAVGTGLAEMNSRGYGFCNYRWL